MKFSVVIIIFILMFSLLAGIGFLYRRSPQINLDTAYKTVNTNKNITGFAQIMPKEAQVKAAISKKIELKNSEQQIIATAFLNQENNQHKITLEFTQNNHKNASAFLKTGPCDNLGQVFYSLNYLAAGKPSTTALISSADMLKASLPLSAVLEENGNTIACGTFDSF